MTDVPRVTGLGLAPMDVSLTGWVTSSVVDPVEAAVPLPEYVPNTRSLPSGAADELHDPLPWDDATRQAWQDAYRALAAAMRRGLSSGTLTKPDLSPILKTAGG